VALRKRWRDLDRSTVGSAPDRYGVYELGDAEGESLGYGVGPLRDDLKEVLAYGDVPNPHPDVDPRRARPEKVRWEEAESLDHAAEVAAERF
jgi:hypothetical protein